MDQKAWHTLLHRPLETHKYDYGHVLIVGGSEAMTGAAVLTGRAALRVGAGLVTIASTEAAVELIDRDIEEIMTFSLPAWEKAEKYLESVRNFISERHVSVLIIGPGLPRSADRAIHSLLTIELPIVIDAEAFTSLSDHLSVLRAATEKNKNIVITPHPGEYSRLVHGQSQYESSGNASIIKFAQDYGVTLVLKQHRTLVVSTDGELFTNTTGNPGLATAGSGDVLTGVIAGIVAQKKTSLYQAAIMGVYLHGLAADITVKSKTEPGMIASDVIEAIPRALKLLDENS